MAYLKSFLVLTTLTFFLVCPLSGQHLPVNETGVIAFEEIIEIPGYNKELLYTNAKKFLDRLRLVNQRKKVSHLVEHNRIYKIETRGGFMVYNLKSPAGEIQFRVSVQVKDYKYRYSISNFVFRPYSRNRYGRYEIEKWEFKALEDPGYKGDQLRWEKYKLKTESRIQSLIEDLKLTMTEVLVEAKKKAILILF